MILKRIEDSRFSEVLPLWDGKRVFIIAGGPSLTTDQVEMVKYACDGGGVIAVNDAYLLAPWADCCYFADSHWWRWHHERSQFKAFAGQKCTIENSGTTVTDDAVHMLRNRYFPSHGMGLSLDPRALVTGRNSGFQALNLAVLAGAKRVILLGFDGKPGDDGKAHWFGEHPQPTPAAAYPLYRQAMSAAENELKAAGVEVLNCSPGSAIDTFPKVALEDVL